MTRGGMKAAGLLIGAAVILAAVGCGGGSKFPTLKVSGKVTLDGAPLESGGISFVPAGEGQDDGGTIKNGEYSLTKSPKGKVKVFITASKATGKMLPGASSSKEIPEVVNLIPKKYASGIDQEITQSRRDLNFELSSQ